MIRVGDEMQIPWRPGITVDEVLDLVPGGHDCAALRINGRILARPRFPLTPVPDEARIDLIPMIAGG